MQLFSFGVGEITEEEKNLLSKTKHALHEGIKTCKGWSKTRNYWS